MILFKVKKQQFSNRIHTPGKEYFSEVILFTVCFISMLLYETLQYYILSADLPREILIKYNIEYKVLNFSYLFLLYKTKIH